MENLKEFIFVLVAVVFVVTVIGIATMLLKVPPIKNSVTLEGNKDQIATSIVQMISKCLAENFGKRTSVICFEVRVESEDVITSNDLAERIKDYGIDRDKIELPDTLQNNNIVIRYENEFVYVEVVDGERIRG